MSTAEPDPAAIAHVEMSFEAYDRIPEDQRVAAWQTLIRKLGHGDEYLPIPYVDHDRRVHGMNLVRIPHPTDSA